MPKRSVTELQTSSTSTEQLDAPTSKSRATGSGDRPSAARGLPSDDFGDMGEFEDAYEDEIEEEDVLENQSDNEGMEVDDRILPAIEESDPARPQRAVYLPGVHQLDKDEVLEPDMTVYEMLHQMSVHWPCLSFDILRDNLGDDRHRYPATSYIVSGTQADSAKKNEVLVMKMSQLHRTQKDADASDSEDESDDEDDDAVDEDAILEYKSIPHVGGVNRVRAQPLPAGQPLPVVAQPYYISTWADTGKVHIWDVRPLIEALDTPGYHVDKDRTNTAVHTVKGHTCEGFAMDWGGDVGTSGSSSSLRLVTGDGHSKILLTTSTPSGFNTAPQPFTSHTSSVEDLQWSPTELTVFASCSADQSVRIWDIRVKGRKSVVGIPNAHSADVNVISWNRTSSYLLLSGGDEGGLKTWDLRNLKGAANAPTPSPVASCSWHTGPITSVEWHPTDESIFCASGADDQVTLWDLGVELDADEMHEEVDASGREVPPQLLFIHQGQTHIKEIHWHPQIPGTVASTSADGFNIFKTISV